MKILHVTHGYPPADTGGIERYLEMVVPAQRAAGHEIVILAGSIEPRDPCTLERQEVDGVPVHRLYRDDWFHDHYAHSYHPGASARIRQLLIDERPDLVHLHQWIRLSSDLVAQARSLDLATVVTLHDVYTSCPRAFRIDRDEAPCRRRLTPGDCGFCVPRFGQETEAEVALGIELFHRQYQHELACADEVLVAAQVTADLLHEVTGLPADRCTPHDLPYTPRFADHPTAPPAAGDPLRFAYWGSLTPHKGPQVLLEAFRELRREPPSGPPVELHLFGPLPPDPMGTQLRERAAGLPVTFHGPFGSEQLAAAGIAIGVFPVICFEGFGLGLTEAFELGLPAIVSDIGALADRIGDAGLRVPPGDPVALAAAMRRMATDPPLRDACRAAIPALPPSARAHVAYLDGVYAKAVAKESPAPIQTPAPTPEERSQLFLLQRESYARALRDAVGRRAPR